MNELDIVLLEQNLGVKLPADYKQLLLNYPRELEKLGAKELHLIDDIDWLVEQNLFARESPSEFFWWKKEWNKNYFVIGEDGNGNCFYINLSEKENPSVYFLNHEAPDEDDVKIAPDFNAWIIEVEKQLTKYKLNAEALAIYKRKKEQNRSWWKFW